VRKIRGHEIAVGALVATAFWAVTFVLTSNGASDIIGFALRKIGSSIDIFSALTAVATIFIAGFTFTLKRSTDKLWNSAEKQVRAMRAISIRQDIRTEESIRLARRDFIATHRPRVGVAFIQGPFVKDSRQFVWVTVANNGGSDAIIHEWGCDLVRRKGKQWLTGIDGSPQKIERISLISGQRHFFEVFAKAAYDEEAAIFEEALDEVETCVIGAIRYVDENGTMRETGFFRTFHTLGEKFIPSENPEDEYQA
jgi:hypothetical protein